jgi:uncharacterized protein (DUF169 family)
MDMDLKSRFAQRWNKYFNNAELPITFFYTDSPIDAEIAKAGKIPRCIMAALTEVRKGRSLAFDVDAVGCPGGKRYLGFKEDLMPNFNYFLSCGIPGKVVGERYKKSPELVDQAMAYSPVFHAPARYIVFKRWDQLEEADQPEVTIFYTAPDVLAGLFTLANYDEAEPNGVFAPFGSGCSSVIQYPYLEKDKARPRAIIGMFDVSARPFADPTELAFSVPMPKFTRMVDNIEESFLLTNSWKAVQKRIETK